MKQSNFARTTTFFAGLFYLATSLSMFATPRWFFENVGHFPPFNRHYMGDLASFLFPLAIGLLLAARDPFRYRLIVGLSALASIIHIANHLYDAIAEQITNGHWLLDFTPLVLLASALTIAYRRPAIIKGINPAS